MLVFSLTAFAVDDTNPDPYQRIVIVFLHKSINQAITDYYGGPYQRGHDLYNAAVIDLSPLQGWAKFNVTVQVMTFVGAHNPPYALEIMTFRVDLGEEPVLIEYTHKDL
jgi:hypothetical protein